MSAKLLLEFELHAGGGWEGHVFFLDYHPITKEMIRTNSLKAVQDYCQLNSLEPDPDSIEQTTRLDFSEKYGYLVPAKYIDPHRPISSAYNYLKNLKKELINE